jgi:biotin carboxylase
VKTVLVLGGGLWNLRVTERVRAAGYRTLVADRDPSAPAFALADAGHAVDISDTGAVVEIARREGVDAVLPLSEAGVPSAAAVAGALGLRGLSEETALQSLDKGLMRERWDRDGLPNPPFRVVTTRDEAARAAAAIGPPLIVKPARSGGGGRGVSVVHELGELDWAWEFARPSARNGRVMVEGFLEGTELTVEAIAHRGEVHVLAISDKVKPPLRTRVATSLNYPAALEPDTRARVEAIARAAVVSLGITDGPAHAELIVGHDGPMLVELGARGGGGHVFSTVIEAVSGVDAVRESVRVLAGDEPDLRVRRQAGCVYRLLSPVDGVVRAIHGVEAARGLPGVLAVGVTRKPGDVLGGLIDSLQRSGFAVVAGSDREEAIRRADEVERTVVFDLEPVHA